MKKVCFNIIALAIGCSLSAHAEKARIAAGDSEGLIQKKILENAVIEFETGTYFLTTPIQLHSNLAIRFDKGVTLIQNSPRTRVFVGRNVSNVSISTPSAAGNGDQTEIKSGAGLSNLVLGAGNDEELYNRQTSNSAIDISDSQNITISGLILSHYDTLIWCVNSTGVFIERNRLFNFTLYGMVLSGSKNFRVALNNISDSKQLDAHNAYAVAVTQPDLTPAFGVIEANVLENIPTWDAIMSHQINYLWINDNRIRNVRTGIDLSSSFADDYHIQNVTVSNNIMTGTTEDRWNGSPAINGGIVLVGDLATKNYVTKIVISGNTIGGFNKFNVSHGSGIGLGVVSEVTVSGNIIYNCGNVTNRFGGITLNNYATSVKIMGNQITNGGSTNAVSLVLGKFRDVIIQGNDLRASEPAVQAATLGIKADVDATLIVSNNLVTGYPRALLFEN